MIIAYTKSGKEGKQVVNVRDIAAWFLAQDSMTHKKLQKLCYFAQAWFCALYDGTPLYNERIEAWVHGPVIPSLYPIYADYKWNDIPKQREAEPFNENITKVLQAVYNTYGRFTGDQLESLTHDEQPWKDARGTLEPWESCTTAITTSSMREYYRRKYEQNQND